MKRVVILGGGVGGTLTANLVARKLKARDRRGDGQGHRRRRDRPARVPARLHVHRHGPRSEPSGSSGNERPLLDGNVDLVVGRDPEDRRRGVRGSSSPPARRSTSTSS